MGVGLEYGVHGWFCGPVGAIFGLFTPILGIHPKMSIVRVHWVLRVFDDLGKFVCFSQKRLKIKEVESLLKMHFKPQGSSAVDELQKLTD